MEVQLCMTRKSGFGLAIRKCHQNSGHIVYCRRRFLILTIKVTRKSWSMRAPTNTNWEFYPGGLEFSYLPRIHKSIGPPPPLLSASGYFLQILQRMMIGGSGDILCERMVGCWGNGPVWCSILVLQLRCEQGSCSIIYGSWVSKRILILRDRIPNFTLGPTSKTNKLPLLFLVIVVQNSQHKRAQITIQ